eukprot:14222667-Alexandrium_andersonii.AAC.1
MLGFSVKTVIVLVTTLADDQNTTPVARYSGPPPPSVAPGPERPSTRVPTSPDAEFVSAGCDSIALD